MSFEDKTLACRDCGTEFTFTAGEQEFYAQKGFDNAPTRCQNCRRARKSQRSEGGGYGSERSYGGGGGGYSSSSYGNGGGGYGGGGGGYAQRERVQHETTCSQCGRTTTVPFVPRGDRPVYCNDCFSQQRGGSSRGGGGGYNRGGGGGGYNRY